ncbi:nitrous oxide reductase family maturation protein NosD [Salisaeta longa]|uniref:nitrous oxide reductase family maturation protein NosD n=1 Tax=Salisaeta longa TaxID=503170 RepID=UPI0003B655CE|nr:nitrous oxide reductase family maturation protein NosD [Salisaeta longa]
MVTRLRFQRLWQAARCVVLGLAVAGLAAPAAGQTLAQRLAAAAPGDTVVVRGGIHPGPFSIDTPLVLIGRGRPVLSGNGATHVVTINAPHVTVQGFVIRRSGKQLNQDHAGVMVRAPRATVRDNVLRDVLHGIYVKGVGHAYIQNNRITGQKTRALAQRGNGIHLWKSTHNRIAGNRIRHTRDGIYFSFADRSQVLRNTVHHVRYGLHYMYSDHNTFAHNVFYGNVSGSALMYSSEVTARHNTFRNNRSQGGYGLLVQSLEASTFTDNRLIGNTFGVYLENTSNSRFEGNVVARNYTGVRLTGSSMGNRFSGNVVEGNLHTAALAGTQGANTWHIGGRGNYWGPTGLLDLTGDGVSEWPHRTVDLMAVARADFPLVGVLAGSPGLALAERVVQRVPLASVPTIVDPHPLMYAPGAQAGGGWPGWAVGLLGAGVLVGWGGYRWILSLRNGA